MVYFLKHQVRVEFRTTCFIMHRARRANVYLNVYELMSFDKYNGYLIPVGLGAYHSGVEVYGEEFSFGFHEADYSGVFTVDPRSAPDCRFMYVTNYRVTHEDRVSNSHNSDAWLISQQRIYLHR